MYNQHLFLIGFMGCGKSYWGKQLAEYAQRPFIDLDHRIEMMENKRIAEIFESGGELSFRKIEQQYLKQLKEEQASIISTGGGTPCFFDNMAQMNQMGKSIFLDVPEEILFERLSRGRAKRPLLSGLNDEALMAFIHERLAERRPFYEKADICITWNGDAKTYREMLYESIQKTENQ